MQGEIMVTHTRSAQALAGLLIATPLAVWGAGFSGPISPPPAGLVLVNPSFAVPQPIAGVKPTPHRIVVKPLT
jgi:hypothetical protein